MNPAGGRFAVDWVAGIAGFRREEDAVAQRHEQGSV
jgi:hypothetical protein